MAFGHNVLWHGIPGGHYGLLDGFSQLKATLGTEGKHLSFSSGGHEPILLAAGACEGTSSENLALSCHSLLL